RCNRAACRAGRARSGRPRRAPRWRSRARRRLAPPRWTRRFCARSPSGGLVRGAGSLMLGGGRLKARGPTRLGSPPVRVLVVTNLFPTARRPALGPFVRDQVEAVRALGGAELELHSFD